MLLLVLLLLLLLLLLLNTCSTHTIGYQIVYPNDQNPKNLVLFYLLLSVPKAACGKSPELRARAPGAEGIVRVGKLKLTFHCVFVVCVCEVFVAA